MARVVPVLLISLIFALPASSDEANVGFSRGTKEERRPESLVDYSKIEVVTDLDTYDSYVNVHFPLTKQPIEELDDERELHVYRYLLVNSLKPRYFNMNLHAYPVAAGASYLKSNERDFYDKFEIGGTGVNLIQAVSAEYEEPWSAGFFVGNVVQYVREDTEYLGTNKGYMGYEVSFGTKHLKDNVLIDDNWWSLGWRFRGERDFGRQQHYWDVVLAVKTHGNPEIADVIMFGTSRSHLSYESKLLSWLNNGSLDFSVQVTRDKFDFARGELIFGKKFPLRKAGVSLNLSFGLIYQNSPKYRGSLKDDEVDEFILVLAPSFEF